MARFLDRMLGDLIKKNTGFNARPFVRMVGGKNLLLLGGAAIAGIVASEKMQGQNAPEATPGPPRPNPPPSNAPPPLPRQSVAPPPIPPPIPNLPQAEGVAEDGDLPQSLVFAIVRAMVATALSDGTLSPDERKLIQDHLGESGLNPEQIQQVQKELLIPATAGEIASGVDSTEDREMVFRFAAVVAASDKTIVEAEKQHLSTFAEALGIAPPRAAQIQAEVFTT